ncbi:MAG: FAD-dependent oxidoreductase, partial [Betaproteobacteria bacterium]|nr:FAD-dependent oxidoreductase [Betaproteobacteria bacterium]
MSLIDNHSGADRMPFMGGRPVIVVGAGIGGMTAAITAAEAGLDVTLIEKGDKVGGAAAYSGGQVWAGANHVAARLGLEDSVGATLEYVHAAANRDAASIDSALCERWIRGAAGAARWLGERGAIRWEVIPDYPDYYFPALPGSRPAGRYLTGAPFDGHQLGESRALLHVSPHFPVGITYGEMFAWGGMSSKTRWDWELVAKRKADDILTFGTGIAAALFMALLERRVKLLLGTAAVELVATRGRVTGLRARGPQGDLELQGPVILATGAHDWSAEYSGRFTGIPPDDGGSVTPSTISGDAMSLVAPLGGDVHALPAWAAPVLPGYRFDAPQFPGDTGYRACFEHCLPHTFLVNRQGRRFADDSFHSTIVAEALKHDAAGKPANLPIFMIWDEDHHAKYGLGRTMPGGEYTPGLVASAPTLAELAAKLGVDPDGLAATAKRFNAMAREGTDRDFGRGSNLSVRRFRGDWNNRPNPNMAPVERAPFFGMRIRLLNTGIAAGGVRSDGDGRVQRADGSVIEGLYAVGESSARAAAGVGYNSGYSLSRAMAF